MKDNVFPLRQGTKHGHPLSPLLFNIVVEVLVHTKSYTGWKGKKKTLLFTDNIIIYVENPKESKGTTISKFSKIVGYAVNMSVYESIIFLKLSINKCTLKFLIDTIYNSIKIVKHLGINLTKDV